jgi:hypothetical protein
MLASDIDGCTRHPRDWESGDHVASRRGNRTEMVLDAVLGARTLHVGAGDVDKVALVRNQREAVVPGGRVVTELVRRGGRQVCGTVAHQPLFEGR